MDGCSVVDPCVVSIGVEGKPVVENPVVVNIVLNSSIVVVRIVVTGDVLAVDNLVDISPRVVVTSIAVVVSNGPIMIVL